METWHKIERWGSEHPVLLGLGIFIVGALLLWMFLPAGKQQEAAAPDSGAYLSSLQADAARAGNTLAAYQAAAKADMYKADQELAGTQATITGYVDIAKLQTTADVDIS